LKHYIFADESNINQARFLLIGGIWIDEVTYNSVKEECKQYKLSIGWREDTKFNWKNISNNDHIMNKYKGFIDIFFKYNLQFNAILIDRKEINLKHNEKKDAELGFYLFYYQLLKHNSNKNIDYYIFLDRRNNKSDTRLDDLKKFLINEQLIPTGLKFNPVIKGINVKKIEAVNYKDYNLIQISDLLLGAIGFHYNKRHVKEGAMRAKCEFALYIANKIGTKNLIFSTGKKGYKNLNLWLFKSLNEKASYDLQIP